jgi:hypothetical protein
MPHQIQNFEREYASRTTDDLLRLASEPQNLVDGASMALHSELSRRGLKAADIDTARYPQEKHAQQHERKAAERLLHIHRQGIGTSRFCKWDRVHNVASGTEEFTTTLFFILAWVPLIPLGTYRVRRSKGLVPNQHVIEKLPLNWSQVLWVWMIALLTMLALALVFQFALSLLPH